MKTSLMRWFFISSFLLSISACNIINKPLYLAKYHPEGKSYPLPECLNPHDKDCIFLIHPNKDGQAILKNEQEFLWPSASEVSEYREPHFKLGVALSGGGSKASAFAIGVLAGLADVGLLGKSREDKKDKVDVISSVSGGSYAAWFHFTREYATLKYPGKVTEYPSDWYADCLSNTPQYSHQFTGLLANKIPKAIFCDKALQGAAKLENGILQYPHQYFLKCAQDIFRPGWCDMAPTSQWLSNVSAILMAAGKGLLLIPAHHMLDTAFDGGYNFSELRRIYRDGIGVNYGAVPIGEFKSPLKTPIMNAFRCLDNPDDVHAGMAFCKNDVITFEHPATQRFDQINPDCNPTSEECSSLTLKKYSQIWRDKKESEHMPFWIISAASAQHRGLEGWLGGKGPDIIDDTFEFTPVSYGSRRYGHVHGNLNELPLLDAVVSSAAFADPNQQVVPGLIGPLAYLLNLNWGVDIANYNVSDHWRSTYKFLPIPAYLLPFPLPSESSREKNDAFIRLEDGGNADDLGLYPLLRRNVPVIVVADEANDSNGSYEDICRVKNQLAEKWENLHKFLFIPGLHNLEDHCALAEKFPDKYGYPIKQWSLHFPVLLGCVTVETNPTCSQSNDLELIRLILLKPSYDYAVAEKSRKLVNNQSQISSCWIGDKLYTDDTGTKTLSDVLSALDDNPELARFELNQLPCETLSFLGSKDFASEHFPQNSTVWMTFNSSFPVFAAYRELARDRVTKASLLISDKMEFSKEVIRQYNARMVHQKIE